MKSVYSILFVFFAVSLSAQVPLTKICSLPKVCNESSGVVLGKHNTIWTNNDSGDKPLLYQVNRNGELLRQVYIKNALGIDIEELALQQDKFIYVADIGNNSNDRKNLSIYKIKSNQLYAKDSVEGEVITFHYPDQLEFPPQRSDKNFDCEAFFWYKHKLYLFSKNRGKSLYTKIYTLPDVAGNYTATLVDSFFCGGWVTSADINPSKNTVALVSSASVYLIPFSKKGVFDKEKAEHFSLPSSQLEAIAFKDDSTLWLTDEKNCTFDGNLYEVKLGTINTVAHPLLHFSVPQYPQNESFYISYNGTASDTVQYSIVDSQNVTIKSFSLAVSTRYGKDVNLAEFKEGKYTLHFKSETYEEVYEVEYRK